MDVVCARGVPDRTLNYPDKASRYLNNIPDTPGVTLPFVVYSLGFSGDLGEDNSHSSALYCDPRDMRNNRSGECANPARHRLASVPATFFSTGYQVTHWTHRGFYRIDKEFSKWFLSGIKPSVTNEFVAWNYRQHPMGLPSNGLSGDKCPLDSIIWGRYDDSNKLVTDPVNDVIYITSLLEHDGQLEVSFGGDKDTINLPAGQLFLPVAALRQNTEVSYHYYPRSDSRARYGTPHFKLTTNGQTYEWDGRLEITDQPVQFNGQLSRNPRSYADYCDLNELNKCYHTN